MKRPLPNNPMQGPMQGAPPAAPQGNKPSFDTFMQNTQFLRNVMHPHFPEPNTGTHVPVWLSPKLANDVLSVHGKTGHAIPHPNINLKDLSR